MNNDSLYKYNCPYCDAEYVTKEHDLKYCESDECSDTKQHLNGPYTVKE